MFRPIHNLSLLQSSLISFNSSVLHLNLGVHETQVGIHWGNFGMIVSRGSLKDGQSSMHWFEGFRVVADVVVVHGQSWVVETDVRMIHTQQSFSQHDCFGLQFNSLQKVAKFELNAGDVWNTLSYVFVHRSLHLEKHANYLRVNLKCFLKLAFFLRLISLRHHVANIHICALDLLNVREKTCYVGSLEGKFLVVRKDVLLG